MAIDFGAMFGGEIKAYNINQKAGDLGSIERICSKTCHSRMAFEKARTKSKTLSRFKHQISTSFNCQGGTLERSQESARLWLVLTSGVLQIGMPPFVGKQKRFARLEMCLSSAIQSKLATRSKVSVGLTPKEDDELHCPLIPGLPEDVAKFCLALVPRCQFPVMAAVCKSWRSFIQTKELISIRKEAVRLEEWIYILTGDTDGRKSHWEVLRSTSNKNLILPPMPGPEKAGFGVVVVNGKLLVMAGYSVDHGKECVSDDVYQYDSRLNRWSMLAKMNFARYDFACAEVDGVVYAVGGYGSDGDSLSSAEAYDPDKNEWSLIENIRRPRWACFACGFDGKLYVMGGRSSFTIGNSRFVDIYNPASNTWLEMKNGCVMVTAHAVIGKKLICIQWKDQRKLAIFNPVENSWKNVEVPLTGSSTIKFRFGILNGKLLIFSQEEEPGYQTLLYDPDAPAGLEWGTSSLKPSGLCLCSVTIKI